MYHFKMSLDNSQVPGEIKDALISPIFKGIERGLASNFHLIPSHLGKVLKRVIKEQMVEHMEAWVYWMHINIGVGQAIPHLVSYFNSMMQSSRCYLRDGQAQRPEH